MSKHENVPTHVIQNMRDHAHAQQREWQRAPQDADAAVVRIVDAILKQRRARLSVVAVRTEK